MGNHYFFKKITLILFSLGLGVTGYSQTVSAVIVDEESQQPVTHAKIMVGNNYSSISSSEGAFSLNPTQFSPSDSISIHGFGFQPHKISFADFSAGKIQLKKQEYRRPFFNLYEYMEKVQEKMESNYSTNFSKYKIFHRSSNYTTVSDAALETFKTNFLGEEISEELKKELNAAFKEELDKMNEEHLDFTAEFVMNDENEMKLQLLKASTHTNKENFKPVQIWGEMARLAGDKINSESTYKVKTGIFTIEDNFKLVCEAAEIDSLQTATTKENLKKSWEDNYLYPKAPYHLNFMRFSSQYLYRIDQLVEMQGQDVYIFSFKPKSSMAKYVGKLYISAKDHAILRADYKLDEGKSASKVNMKFLFGIAMEKTENHGVVIYEKNAEGKYMLKYFKNTSETEGIINRKIRMVENTDQGKKQKIKTRLRLASKKREITEMLVMEANTINSEAFEAFQENKGTEKECLPEYDASRWKTFPNLQPRAISVTDLN